MMFYSDDPVADFERYDCEQCRQQRRHYLGKCAHCGEEIYDYDDYYDFDGELVCDDCLIDWAKHYKQKGI